jgi:hypothetical protein
LIIAGTSIRLGSGTGGVAAESAAGCRSVGGGDTEEEGAQGALHARVVGSGPAGDFQDVVADRFDDGTDGALGGPDRRRGLGGDRCDQVRGRCVKAGLRDAPVGQADPDGLGAGEEPPGDQQVQGRRRAGEQGDAGGEQGRHEDAPAGDGHADAGVLGDDAQVAGAGELAAGAHGGAPDAGDDGDGEPFDGGERRLHGGEAVLDGGGVRAEPFAPVRARAEGPRSEG